MMRWPHEVRSRLVTRLGGALENIDAAAPDSPAELSAKEVAASNAALSPEMCQCRMEAMDNHHARRD